MKTRKPQIKQKNPRSSEIKTAVATLHDSQWLVTYGHHLAVAIYLHVAPTPSRHIGHLSNSKAHTSKRMAINEKHSITDI